MSNSVEKVHPAVYTKKEMKRKSIFLVKNICISFFIVQLKDYKRLRFKLFFKEVLWSKKYHFRLLSRAKVSVTFLFVKAIIYTWQKCQRTTFKI